MTESKIWSERDFDECCFAVSGFGPQTMVCAEPCVGSYCGKHRAVLDASHPPRKRVVKHKRAAKVMFDLAPRVRQPWEPDRRVREVRAAVAARHGLSIKLLLSGGPSPRYALARQEACWEIRQLGRSYPQVAKAVGLKDHTSAIHACKRHEARRVLAGLDLAA